MNKTKVKTSKGDFLIIDGLGEEFEMLCSIGIIKQNSFIKMRDLTEEQAKDIVDEGDCTPWLDTYKNGYRDYSHDDCKFYTDNITAIESFISLIHSKGLHSFKNPVIFKL